MEPEVVSLSPSGLVSRFRTGAEEGDSPKRETRHQGAEDMTTSPRGLREAAKATAAKLNIELAVKGSHGRFVVYHDGSQITETGSSSIVSSQLSIWHNGYLEGRERSEKKQVAEFILEHTDWQNPEPATCCSDAAAGAWCKVCGRAA